MQKVLTKRQLIEQGIDAVDPEGYQDTPVIHRPAVGVSRVDLPQVVEVAKLMAGAGQGVPEHLRGNAGMCLRVVFQAVEWQMSPFSVADQSYVVRGRLSYMSQLLHAVVEARAPLQHRLSCSFDGSGDDKTCTVVGMFTNGDVRDYTTPPLGDIKKRIGKNQQGEIKGSPLWESDPERQLFYFASRAWARMWCPDVLLGVYTREELIENPRLGREFEEEAPGLHERLSGAPPAGEGHRPGHAARELAQIGGGGVQTIEHEPSSPPVSATDGSTEAGAEKPTRGAKKRGRPAGRPSKAKARLPADAEPEPGSMVDPESMPSGREIKAAADRAETAPAKAEPEPLPKTVPQYLAYAKRWILASTSVAEMEARWKDERAIRNNIGMTSEDRSPLEDLLRETRTRLEA